MNNLVINARTSTGYACTIEVTNLDDLMHANDSEEIGVYINNEGLTRIQKKFITFEGIDNA